ARALIDRGQRHALIVVAEVAERQREGLLRTAAAYVEPPGIYVDLGNHREVITHEEGVIRRERRHEVGERRLVVGRPPGAPDQRLLAGQRAELGPARGGGGGARAARAPAEQPAAGRSQEQVTPARHAALRAGLAVIGTGALRLRLRLRHVGTGLRLAVPA